MDGQAQLDVGGEDVNNSRAKRAAKLWIGFSSVRRRILQASLAMILNVSLARVHMRIYVHTLPDFTQ